MAQPGDPTRLPPTEPEPEVDHDAGVGFASASSLQGRPRARTEAEPPFRRDASDDADLFASEPEVQPFPRDPAPFTPVPTAAQPARSIPPQAVEPTPAWARQTPPAQPTAPPAFGARRDGPNDVEGGVSLFTNYALILCAVPTLGVSALIALLAVGRRAPPANALAASHFVFQQRTLWIGAIAALIGAVLIAVGLGVFVLFLLAVWLILRGAAGVLKLKAGRPIPDPRAWLI